MTPSSIVSWDVVFGALGIFGASMLLATLSIQRWCAANADASQRLCRPATVKRLSFTGGVFLLGGACALFVTTVANRGGGADAPPTRAQLKFPRAIALDASANVFIADTGNNRVRKLDAASGALTTVAGSGDWGYSGDDGPATEARLDGPMGVAVDAAGNLYIADYLNGRLRKVAANSGVITTVASALRFPAAVAVNSAGDVYVTETEPPRLRKLSATTGAIATIGDSADMLGWPAALTTDPAGNVYVADTTKHDVVKMDAGGHAMTRIAGGGLRYGDGFPATSGILRRPTGLALDAAGNLYVADCDSRRVRKVLADTGVMTTIAGGASQHSAESAALRAELPSPCGLAISRSGNIYILDTDTDRLLMLTSEGELTTILR